MNQADKFEKKSSNHTNNSINNGKNIDNSFQN
jgi:hypothetical protein